MDNELEQWCEIDGHTWISTYLVYGLVLGSKNTHISRYCDKCKKVDDVIFIPCGEDKYSLPLYRGFGIYEF